MTPLEAYIKAEEIYPQKDKELEAIIATDAMWSFWYVKDVLNGRFIEGENAIATKAHYSYFYAKDVIKGRFIKGEDVIATNADYSYNYAKYVLKGRFPEGEKKILKPGYFKDYFNILTDEEKEELLTEYPQLINDLI